MDRTRKLSEEILRRHPEAFGSDYDENKKALAELTIIPSKQLRNHIAGYITRANREETTEEEPPSEVSEE
ncbi:MAG TPA: hypothetical protein VFE91_05660 [Nitrososphaerales archaeon]|nr:hypothetical protein [Nitrososphaerales archaeon]